MVVQLVSSSIVAQLHPLSGSLLFRLHPGKGLEIQLRLVLRVLR